MTQNLRSGTKKIMTEFWLKKINEYWNENELTEEGIQAFKANLADSEIFKWYSTSAFLRGNALEKHASKDQIKELKLWLKKAKKDWDEKRIAPVDMFALPISELDSISELKHEKHKKQFEPEMKKKWK